MIVSQLQQRTPEWLALRRGVITASQADRLLTPAKLQDYALELAAERLVRELPPNIVTPAMQWGIDHEEAARLRYAFERRCHVTEVAFVWKDQGWIGCSPDGLVSNDVGHDGLVEIKCPSSKRHLQFMSDGKPPKEYMSQMQFQLWVTGRSWCDFVSFDPRFEEGGDFFCIAVLRDEGMIAALANGAATCKALIAHHVLNVRAGSGKTLD